MYYLYWIPEGRADRGTICLLLYIERKFILKKKKKPNISGWSVYFFSSYESTIDGFAAFDYQTTGFHAISVLKWLKETVGFTIHLNENLSTDLCY